MIHRKTMMIATAGLAAIACTSAGCTKEAAGPARRDEIKVRRTGPAVSKAARAGEEAAQDPVTAREAKPPMAGGANEKVELDGLTLMFFEDGRIEFRGRDRWGASLDTVYQDLCFLKNALGVLSRSLKPGQARQLEEVVMSRTPASGTCAPGHR